MENVCVDITSCGQRVKHEAQNKGYTNQDIADLLHYSSSKQISPFYSGRQQFSDGQLEILSNALGVRKNYLLCMDNYRTDNDVIEGETELLKSKYQYTFSFLRSIGFVVEYVISDNLTPRDIYNQLDTAHKNMFWEEIRKDDLSATEEEIFSYLEGYSVHATILDKDDMQKIEYLLTDNTNYKIYVSKDNNKRYFSREEFLRFLNSLAKSTEFIFETFF